MGSNIDALKRTFREERHAEAVTQCEAALVRGPQSRELQRLCATMHAMTGGYARALELLRAFPADAGGWANLAHCKFELDAFDEERQAAAEATRLDPVVATELAKARITRGDALQDAGKLAERKHVEIPVTAPGRCYGLIQWVRIELAAGIVFENHPSRRRTVSNWQHTIYGFDEPVQLAEGAMVRVRAWHDRARPRFALADGA